MRAGLRFTTILLAGALWSAPGIALAQQTTPPATTSSPATSAPSSSAPATDTIGPRELQDFKLPGTTTRPTEPQRSAPAAASTPAQSNTEAPVALAPQPPTPRPRRTDASREPARTAEPTPVATAPVQSAPSPEPAAITPEPQSAPVATASELPANNGPLAAPPKPSMLPWLLAAFALAAGAILFFWWRSRPREAFAGGAQAEYFSAPEPAVAPEPAFEPVPLPPVPPVPAPRRPSSGGGVVASRLRPALEIGMQPLRCTVDDSQVTIEFEVELFNAGTAPARFVLAEASLLNASATQDQDLAAFFSNPTGAGDRLDAIPPMRRINLTSKVVAPRDSVHEYELAGRKSFVPVIAFNALYEWSGGKGQTSAAYLVGRETRGDKLGPLRLDLGAREFRGLDARPLPSAVRT